LKRLTEGKATNQP